VFYNYTRICNLATSTSHSLRSNSNSASFRRIIHPLHTQHALYVSSLAIRSHISLIHHISSANTDALPLHSGRRRRTSRNLHSFRRTLDTSRIITKSNRIRHMFKPRPRTGELPTYRTRPICRISFTDRTTIKYERQPTSFSKFSRRGRAAQEGRKRQRTSTNYSTPSADSVPLGT
jgi:hypothetical protein